MRNLIFGFLFLASHSAHAVGTSLLTSPFGNKMVVDYVVGDGKHTLVVKEKTGKESKEVQVVDLQMKPDQEFLSTQFGFPCKTKKKEYVFAIIGKKTARKDGKPFPPERGWTVDEKANRLKPIPDVQSVSCTWPK